MPNGVCFWLLCGFFSIGQVCGFWAGFRILTFLQDFESKDDKIPLLANQDLIPILPQIQDLNQFPNLLDVPCKMP